MRCEHEFVVREGDVVEGAVSAAEDSAGPPVAELEVQLFATPVMRRYAQG